jgi:hypothetical protein
MTQKLQVRTVRLELLRPGPWRCRRSRRFASRPGDRRRRPSGVRASGGLTIILPSPTADKLEALRTRWEKEVTAKGLTPGQGVEPEDLLSSAAEDSTDVEELASRPFKSDRAAPNGSSIALLAEFEGKGVLFAADAHPPVIEASLRTLLEARRLDRLPLDAFKVSHHASQNNVSTELVSLLDCPRFLVSTNGDHFCHPDRQAIARIIKYGKSNGRKPELHFNYRSQYNELWARQDLQEKYGFTTGYPDTPQLGHTVSLLP